MLALDLLGLCDQLFVLRLLVERGQVSDPALVRAQDRHDKGWKCLLTELCSLVENAIHALF